MVIDLQVYAILLAAKWSGHSKCLMGSPHLIRKGRHTSADKVAVQYFTKAANPDNYIYQ